MKSLELLIENEELVSKLYFTYAQRFNEEKKFWLQKSAEEKTHAELLTGVLSVAQELPAFFQEGRFSLETIEITTSMVNTALEKSARCTLKEALAAAREVENSLIERYFFQVMSGDSALVRNVFTKIEEDTRRHREEIQELLLKYASK
jgi:hypothetical protein